MLLPRSDMPQTQKMNRAGNVWKRTSRRKFVEFRDAIVAKKDLAPAEILNVFLETFGYLDYLEQNFINANERQENISELAVFAAEFKTLAELLEKVSLVQSTDAPSGGTEDAHKKGNEEVASSFIFQRSISRKGLSSMWSLSPAPQKGSCPIYGPWITRIQLEEERRLMYVAMTRARKNLFISFSGMPSRFLSEIPQEYLRAFKKRRKGQ